MQDTMQTSFFARNKTWIIILGVIVVIGLWLMSAYNGFVSQNVAIDAQWAQVENQLQRRFDLIPNLISTVKGSSKQELDLYKQITDARAQYNGAKNIDEKATAAGNVESALSRLLVINESNPAFQSIQPYRDLLVQLEGTENRLSVERMKYNDEVKVLNASVKRFPGSIIASLFGITPRTYFEVATEAKVNPKVDFSN